MSRVKSAQYKHPGTRAASHIQHVILACICAHSTSTVAVAETSESSAAAPESARAETPSAAPAAPPATETAPVAQSPVASAQKEPPASPEGPPGPAVEPSPVEAPIEGKAAAPTQLKAVVVTAQRREESAQSVPTAISVVSGDSLVDSGVGRSAGEVLNSVPSGSAATQLHGRPRWWIRGVGTGQQQLDFANPIGFYLDDVYISNASATGFPLFDLDRVEVLRGPQGTLWGKNTTGGAVSVVSRRPSLDGGDGYLKLDYGTFNDKLAEGAANGVIWAKRLAARAAFHIESRDGRFTNLYDNRSAGEFQDAAGRLQLLGRITDDLEALVNVHLRKYTTNGTVATVVSSAPDGTYRDGYTPSTQLSDVNTNAPSGSDVRQTGANLTLKWKLGGYALTAVSGYEQYKETTLADADYTPLEINRTWVDAVSRQLSQEVRIASPRSDKLNWVAGLFYFHEDIKYKNAAAKLPGVVLPAAGAANYSLTAFDHGNASFAPFASATAAFTDNLSLKGGLRWTWEKRTLDTRRIGNSGTPTFGDVVNWWNPASITSPLQQVYAQDLSNTWTNFTYDLTPTVTITPDASVYFRYAHGIKSGGYNTAATNAAALNVVEPEKLNAYELGAKTTWLGRRLTVNAAGFYYDYRDIQVNVVGPLPPTNTAVSYLQNAKKGRIWGAELELEALPIRYLHVTGNLGLLDAKFTDFTALYGGASYSGNRLVRSPKVSTLLRADAIVPLGTSFNVLLGGDWRYQSKQFFYTTNQADPILWQNAYSLVNAHVTLQTADEKVSLVLYANNLLDLRYKNHTLPGSAGATGDVVYWADPRTIGATLITRWW
jgi:iron complex outermembrane receptor protein